LAGVLCGLFLQTYYRTQRRLGWMLAASGGGLLLAVFWAQGRRVLRVHYRRERWTWRDGVVLAACAGSAAVIVLTRLRAPGALGYSPYQRIVPAFDPMVGIALMLLLAPLAVSLSQP
jgi:hypothetical protein